MRWLPKRFGWVVLLLAGVICSVLVAWTGVIQSANSNSRKFQIIKHAGIVWPEGVPDSWPPPEESIRFNHLLLHEYGYSNGFIRQGHGAGHQRYGAWTIHAGFPLRMMHSAHFEFNEDPTREHGRHHDLEYRYSKGSFDPEWVVRRLGIGSWRPLPYRLNLLGLIANTVFYAALLWAPVLCWRAIRWVRRTQEGSCPVCRYDVGALEQCPECGYTLLTPRIAEHATDLT